MKNLVKHIKKYHPKPGDIFVVTLKGSPTLYELNRVKDIFASMDFLKGTYVLFLNDNVQIRKGKPEKGKHKVYLSNLEYLE
jgi:hypothetical protein